MADHQDHPIEAPRTFDPADDDLYQILGNAEWEKRVVGAARAIEQTVMVTTLMVAIAVDRGIRREEGYRRAPVDGDLREALVDALVMTPLSDTQGTELSPFYQAADALLPVIAAHVAQREQTATVAALRSMADQIDRGPDVPLRPSLYAALVRERADDIRRQAAAGGEG